MNSEDQQESLTTSNFQIEDTFEDLPTLLKVKHSLSSLEITKPNEHELVTQQTSPILIQLNKQNYFYNKQFEKRICNFLDNENIFITEATEKQDNYFSEKKAKIHLQIFLKQQKDNQSQETDAIQQSPIMIRKKRVSCIVTTHKFSNLKKNI